MGKGVRESRAGSNQKVESRHAGEEETAASPLVTSSSLLPTLRPSAPASSLLGMVYLRVPPVLGDWQLSAC